MATDRGSVQSEGFVVWERKMGPQKMEVNEGEGR